MKNTIIEGTIVNVDSEPRHGQISIGPEGLIERVDYARPTRPTYAYTRETLIFPGFVDTHVHCREGPEQENIHKEDFHSASLAAINGGVTHLADMPNHADPPIDEDSYDRKRALSRRALVPVTPYAALGPTTEPLEERVPYKAVLGGFIKKGQGAHPYTKSTLFFDDARFFLTLPRYAGQDVTAHLESSCVLAACAELGTHEERRPPRAEYELVHQLITTAASQGIRLKIPHFSTRKGIETMHAARAPGQEIFVEYTDHHLALSMDQIDEKNRHLLQMNPPLRDLEDRLACIEDLRTNPNAMLAGDHAPHTLAEKENRISGVPTLDTRAEIVCWLMTDHRFTPQDIARCCSLTPGRWLKPFLDDSFGEGYGRIAPGYVGSLSVIHPDLPTRVHKGILKTKCGWSPFEGRRFPGTLVDTYVRGKRYERRHPIRPEDWKF